MPVWAEAASPKHLLKKVIQMTKSKYKRIVLILRICNILLTVIFLAFLAWMYWWNPSTRNIPYPKTDSEMQRSLFLMHKKQLLLLIVLISNVIIWIIGWIFRKSALKRELFRTLILLITIIISYFVVL